MRWQHKDKEIKVLGWTNHLCLVPMRIDNTWVWLEWVKKRKYWQYILGWEYQYALPEDTLTLMTPPKSCYTTTTNPYLRGTLTPTKQDLDKPETFLYSVK